MKGRMACTPRSTGMARLVVGYCLAVVVMVALAATAAPAAAAAKPLTNADVEKMAQLGLGDDAIIAKINQVEAVDFNLDVDEMGRLKSAGVSQAVLTAMLKRSTPAQPAGEAGTPVKRSNCSSLTP